MKFYCGEDYEAMTALANIISAQVILKPDLSGTGYRFLTRGNLSQLCRWYKKGDLDFSQVTSVNMRGSSSDNEPKATVIS